MYTVLSKCCPGRDHTPALSVDVWSLLCGAGGFSEDVTQHPHHIRNGGGVREPTAPLPGSSLSNGKYTVRTSYCAARAS